MSNIALGGIISTESKKNVPNIAKGGIFLETLRIKVPPFAKFDIFFRVWVAGVNSELGVCCEEKKKVAKGVKEKVPHVQVIQRAGGLLLVC